MAEPNDFYMEVYGGEKFMLSTIDTHSYDIETIAHALSNLCRYGGHCKTFYSVAQHSVLMADYVLAQGGSKDKAFEALMHDAAEAYMGDMPRPIKYLLPDYLKHIDRVEEAIAKKYSLPYPLSKDIKDLDFRILANERRDIMLPTTNEWICDKIEPLDIDTIDPWTPERAKAEFMAAYNFYKGD